MVPAHERRRCFWTSWLSDRSGRSTCCWQCQHHSNLGIFAKHVTKHELRIFANFVAGGVHLRSKRFNTECSGSPALCRAYQCFDNHCVCNKRSDSAFADWFHNDSLGTDAANGLVDPCCGGGNNIKQRACYLPV